MDTVPRTYRQRRCRQTDIFPPLADIGRPEGLLSDSDIGATTGMEQVAEEIRATGAECISVPCDVRDPASVRKLIETATEKFGGVDIFVNNAGVGYLMRDFQEVTLEEWQLVIDVNLTGAFICTQLAAEQMIKAGRGGPATFDPSGEAREPVATRRAQQRGSQARAHRPQVRPQALD